MKITRKVISLFLALAMLASFVTIPAFAAETPNVTITTVGNVTVIPANGTLTLTASLANIEIASVTSYSWTVPDGSTATATSVDNTIAADIAGTYGVTVSYDTSSTVTASVTLTKADADPDPDPDPSTQTSLSALTGKLSVKTKDTSDNRAADSKVIADAAKFTLNMETEKLDVATGGGSDFTVAAFSVDNGSKWKSGSPTVKDITNLFNKGGTLVLTDKFENKKIVEGKAATDKDEAVAGSILLTFPKIEARAKDTKLIVNYLIYANVGTNGSWTLAKKSAKATDSSLSKLQIAQPADNKKMGADDKYNDFPSTYSIDVEDLPDTGKVAKTTYFIRTAPYTENSKYYPATKGYKVSVSSVTKAPSVKPDYKKELIKPKAGMVINGYEYDKTTAKSDPYDLQNSLDFKETVEVYTAATEKKPRSATMTLALATRAATPDVSAVELDASKGKVKLVKGFEVYDATKKKWGGLPRISKTTDIEVRAKSSAKQGKSGPEGEAASEAVIITLTWGVYDEEKNKSGVIEATMAAPATDAEKVAAVIKKLTAAALKPNAPASADYDEAGAKAAIEAKANALKGTTTLSFVYSDFTAASNGNTGSIKVTVTVTLNDDSLTTGVLTVDIPAVGAEEPDPDKTDSEKVAEVKAALTAAALKPEAPEDVNYDADNVKNEIQRIAKDIKNAIASDVELSFAWGTFTAASGGTDGSIKVTITVEVPDSASDTTVELTIVIPAYIAPLPEVTNVTASGNVITLTLSDPTDVMVLNQVSLSELGGNLTTAALNTMFTVDDGNITFTGTSGGTVALDGNNLVIKLNSKALASGAVGSSSAPKTLAFNSGALTYNGENIIIDKQMTIYQPVTGSIFIAVAE